MEISNIEDYKKILFILLNIHHHFEAALQDGACNDEIRDFMVDNLNDMYDNFADLKTDIEKVIIAKKPFSYKSQLFSEKIIAFLYSNMVKFCRNTKVKGIPISKKFIGNVSAILKDTYCIHHSHITGNILGYAHTFCNEKVRENYYKILVIAHNLFRFDFFFLVKGLRASVWKTRDIVIGGKNPTDINFAYIGNQVQFIDTIKYFSKVWVP